VALRLTLRADPWDRRNESARSHCPPPQLVAHGDPVAAAIEAGHARIRPVLMTALAMIVGMFPMSFSNTTNAPLARAVIGGLIVATVTTLVFVPCVFAIIHGGRSRRPLQLQERPA
jgi:Cu/Ag efflux pump CusA